MKIILCRHGETAWSREGKHTSFTDLPLTSEGGTQAKKISLQLKEISFEIAYSSPKKRALQTASLALNGKEVLIEPLATEWNYGDYEGLTTKEIREKNPLWNLFFDGAPRGESPQEIGERADVLIQKWIQERKTLLLFGHAHFFRVLAMRWIGLPVSDARRFLLSVASISILGFEREQKVIEQWNQR